MSNIDADQMSQASFTSANAAANAKRTDSLVESRTMSIGSLYSDQTTSTQVAQQLDRIERDAQVLEGLRQQLSVVESALDLTQQQLEAARQKNSKLRGIIQENKAVERILRQEIDAFSEIQKSDGGSTTRKNPPFRTRVVALYAKHAPSGLVLLEKTLNQMKGKEDQLMRSLIEKLGAEPLPFLEGDGEEKSREQTNEEDVGEDAASTSSREELDDFAEDPPMKATCDAIEQLKAELEAMRQRKAVALGKAEAAKEEIKSIQEVEKKEATIKLEMAIHRKTIAEEKLNRARIDYDDVQQQLSEVKTAKIEALTALMTKHDALLEELTLVTQEVDAVRSERIVAESELAQNTEETTWRYQNQTDELILKKREELAATRAAEVAKSMLDFEDQRNLERQKEEEVRRAMGSLNFEELEAQKVDKHVALVLKARDENLLLAEENIALNKLLSQLTDQHDQVLHAAELIGEQSKTVQSQLDDERSARATIVQQKGNALEEQYAMALLEKQDALERAQSKLNVLDQTVVQMVRAAKFNEPVQEQRSFERRMFDKAAFLMDV